MTDEQLRAIKARADAATPGPWNENDIAFSYLTIEDATLAAHARTDVPYLVAEVERLRAQLDAVPVEEICRWAYDYQTVDDEQIIVAWAQANDPQREAA